MNKHQSWRDSQIQTDPKMSIFRLEGIRTVSLPKHRTSSSRKETVLQIHFHLFLRSFFVPLQIKGLCDYQKNHVTLKMRQNVQKLRMHTLTVLYLTEKVIYRCFSQSVYFGNFFENCPDCLSLLHFQLIALPRSLTRLM